ncbi:uncharacterized protein LOC131287602 [Anopheles ziemanni]|uniref:uncharacterized protein LOC131260869 n=1 Tax=Anopheles coustani TaxID=139045 RepID=UPI002657BD2D|nr:uncharacterized protein LOC131260869 [Anopheles coustani]XP_058118691.1 uncharacterized protein LOC131260869 [Anopheles coustani]XP_058172649.1 uncharacterized protein LOC131287602 [Anopheles ziemanni]
MTSAEWKREAVEHLIEQYRKQPVLYNMRHPRYYNKASRNDAVSTILIAMHDVRPESTAQDILRKIQTLRTQFGQEITKARRASKHGMAYRPTAWWYKGLSFLQDHIKHRSISPDPNEVDGTVIKKDVEDNTFKVSIIHSDPIESETSNNDYEHSMDEGDYDTEIHYEIDTLDHSNNKTVELKPVSLASQFSKQQTNDSDRKSRGSFAFQPEQQLAPAGGTVVELPPPKEQSVILGDLLVSNDRHRSLGNFVASQMSQIKDDILFYSTQMEVLNVINRGILEQLKYDKGTTSNDGQISQSMVVKK